MEQRKQTLEQLENDIWPEPAYDSHLVMICHQLRKISLEKLTAEDLRILIGQQIGLRFILPLAMELLADNPWQQGDLYPGDLLCSVLGLPLVFWEQNSHLLVDLREILAVVYEQQEVWRKHIKPLCDVIIKK